MGYFVRSLFLFEEGRWMPLLGRKFFCLWAYFRSRMTGEIPLVVWTRGILLDVKDRHGDVPIVLVWGGGAL